MRSAVKGIGCTAAGHDAYHRADNCRERLAAGTYPGESPGEMIEAFVFHTEPHL